MPSPPPYGLFWQGGCRRGPECRRAGNSAIRSFREGPATVGGGSWWMSGVELRDIPLRLCDKAPLSDQHQDGAPCQVLHGDLGPWNSLETCWVSACAAFVPVKVVHTSLPTGVFQPHSQQRRDTVARRRSFPCNNRVQIHSIWYYPPHGFRAPRTRPLSTRTHQKAGLASLAPLAMAQLLLVQPLLKAHTITSFATLATTR